MTARASDPAESGVAVITETSLEHLTLCRTHVNTDDGKRNTEITEPAAAFTELRELVLAQWSTRVTAEIPTAAALGEPLLINMIPTLYDNITEALATTSPRPFGTTGTNLAAVHGRERAHMTDYAPHDLIHELQIFREVLFSISKAKGLSLSKRDAEVIGHSIEEAARESISGYSEADKEKSVGFIASLSHDLRNPLHVASASAQLIQLKTSDPGISQLAQRISRKIGEADAMIQTLLDAAVRHGRIRMKLRLTCFDILSLVEEVCADMPLLGQRVQVDGHSVRGHWCRMSMKRTLENLLANAQKYGDASKPVTVRVRLEDGLLQLSVHNEGPPIPRSETDRLFKSYQRLEDTDVKGWGLGLPYVQNVVESHGGTVTVDSVEGRGTTFTISVPVDARPYVKQ